MRRALKLVPLVLTGGERESLQALARKRTATQSLALRARIVPGLAEESGIAPLTRVAARAGMSAAERISPSGG